MGRYRKKIGSRPYRNYSNEAVENAVASVRKGMSIRKAAEKYNVPPATVQRKVRCKHMNKVGRPTVFSNEDENIIVEALILCGKWGFPITAFDLTLIVKQYLDTKGKTEPRFKNNLPGRFWLKGFLDRNKHEISYKFCENIKRARAAVNPEMISDYFDNLMISLEGVKPEAIVNFDETNFTDDPGKTKVLVRRGFKSPKNIIDASKSSTSVMFAGSASGALLPIYVVYKAEHLYDSWLRGGPANTFYNRTRSGWFDSTTFEDWFFKVVVPYFSSVGEGPKAILGDNLASHLSVKVIQKCAESDIRFIFLPANSSHLTQPLDVAYFRPLKAIWRKTLLEWKQKTRGCIPKDQFPRLLKRSLDQLLTSSENLKSGFRAAGICPLNKQTVLAKLPVETPENNSTSKEWASAFESFLKESRLNTSAPLKVRKKKLQASAGQSLTVSDITNPSNTQNIEEVDVGICDAEEDYLEVNIDSDPLFTQPKTAREEDTDTTVSSNYSVHDTSDSDNISELQDFDNLIEKTTTQSNIIPNIKLKQQRKHVYLDSEDQENIFFQPRVSKSREKSKGEEDIISQSKISKSVQKLSSSTKDQNNVITQPEVFASPQEPLSSTNQDDIITLPKVYEPEQQPSTSKSIDIKRKPKDQNDITSQPKVFKSTQQPSSSKSAKMKLKQILSETKNEHIETEPTSEVSVKMYDFVKIHLIYDGFKNKPMVKEFFAQITEILNENEYSCKFLRKSTNKGIYVFPPVDDIMTVDSQKIISVVKPVLLKRGRYSFNVNVSNIKPNLIINED
ncbi:uncharacterized protein LOC106142869 [Amyelois transitella]|jgi:hypothetical protein|uniref:uncharacterized protein LOC132901736 n=1 Tax=Amyelois transitella TaxID=680683 RepID=UPI00067BC997|nr:unnamed protein product [Amyelois transitella]XP_013189286.1 uncharacterized protein LOC132901736 [Amyelois transitella]XP_013189287.1 unnamed protein product [Amyelois transitella]XP_013191469.1 uncharacterized protein LOC106135653 [Amyelois transitella]XP_013195814.1 uncharacterized protein LOC106139024 [Amyelois transitella]XP_060800567.1 uncharacterized protein LOC106129813 [Amyelois transitella]XP_060801003.1 uncharacterized protein LOC132901775 [Amyelois transitella]XP_060803151.1 u